MLTMLTRKSIVIFCLSFIAAVSFSSEVFGARPMTAQQKSFNLEFKVYRTKDMPANWFKTYDGFYVTKRIDNNWVYGQHTMSGMKMTDIVVGSVDPSTIPELNEAYTYVPAGARPVYIPPLPPESEVGLSSLPQRIENDVPAQVSAYTPPSSPQSTSQKIDVFALAEYASPQQLRDAVSRGANFRVERGHIHDEESDLEHDDGESEYDSGETPLHRAAASNHNPESIRFLISQGLDVDALAWAGASGRYSNIPLSLAIENNNLEVVKVLLDNGADPNGYINTPKNMFMAAIDNKVSARQIIDMLIQAGGNINLHHESDSEGRRQVIDEIHENGVYSLSSASEGMLFASRTALMYAVVNDNPDGVNLLLDLKADPDIRDISNRVALDYALDLPSNSKLRKSSAFTRLRKATKAKIGLGIKQR